jgi:uncharacterized protein (TIGR02145 family)
MKKIILLCSICLLGYAARAQITIGSDNESLKGALLDLKQNTPAADNTTATKGLLLPRVNLTKADKLYPMFEDTAAPGTDNTEYSGNNTALNTSHTGLTVYNQNSCFPLESTIKSGTGVYTWTGTEWLYLGEPKTVQTQPVSGIQPQIPSSLPVGTHTSDRTVYVPYRYADRGSTHALAFTAPDLGAGTIYEWYVDGALRQSSTSVDFAYDLPLSAGRHTVSLNVRDCCTDPPLQPVTFVVGCGAFTAPGVWREFMCHNLGADETADPFTPAKGLNGNYYQWGRKDPVATVNTPSAAIPGWNIITAVNDAWTDGNKTDNDPCPEGYRIPTLAEWNGVADNNLPYEATGSTWNTGVNNYNSGHNFGPALFLPATGYRIITDGRLEYRNRYGYYWSSSWPSSESTGHLHAYAIRFQDTGMMDAAGYTTDRTRGYPVRCIAIAE